MRPRSPRRRALLALALAAAAGRAGAGAATAPGAAQTGIASIYAKRLDGRTTASGEDFDMDALTAAHRTLPFGTRVRVTNLRNRRSVVVRINDRGPAVTSRLIDLTPRAAAVLGMHRRGLARVRVEVVAPDGGEAVEGVK